MVYHPREDEEQVGQAVDVAEQHGIDRRIERDHASLCAAADRPRDVQRGAGRASARQDETAKRRQLGFEPVDQLLEPENMVVVDHRLGHAWRKLVGRIGELGAQGEQIALQRDELQIQRGIDW